MTYSTYDDDTTILIPSCYLCTHVYRSPLCDMLVGKVSQYHRRVIMAQLPLQCSCYSVSVAVIILLVGCAVVCVFRSKKTKVLFEAATECV